MQLRRVLHDGVDRFVHMLGEGLRVGDGEGGLFIEVGEMAYLIGDRPGIGWG